LSEREYYSSVIEAKVLEKANRAGRGGQVQWFVGDVSRDETIDDKTKKSPEKAAELVRALAFRFMVDDFGQPANGVFNRFDPRLDKDVQRGAIMMVNALSNAFQTTIVNPPDNPTEEIAPTNFWLPSPSKLTLNLFNRTEVIYPYTTWTYEGIRMHEGRRRAYCRVHGFMRAAVPSRSTFYGSVIEGHAHFDLDGGYVAESSVKITAELDDSQGRYGALILDFDLTRQPGNVYSIVPSKQLVTPSGPSTPIVKGKLTPVASVTAKLEENDPPIPADIMEKLEIPAESKTTPWPFKAFSLKLEKGKTYVIEMIRTDDGKDSKFDPYLILQGKDMKILAEDDDSAGDLNSRITFECPETETYRLIASCTPPHGASGFKIDVYSTDSKATATLAPER
jgi:hypothetical protein